MRQRIKTNDKWLLVGILVALFLCFVLFRLFAGGQGAYVKVTVDGDIYGNYPLQSEQTVEIEIDGTVTNVLRIDSGEADMISADCPDKLCVHQRAISRQKETIVCLPNKVVVEVVGAEESAFDAVT